MKIFKILSIIALVLAVSMSSYALTVKSFVNNNDEDSAADHERVTISVYNNTDMDFANGDVVAWDTTDDSGRSVTRCNRLGQPVAGVITETIPDGEWGECLVYGYHSAVRVYGAAGYNVTAGYQLYAYGDSTVADNSANTYDGYAGAGILIASFTGQACEFGTALDTYTSTGTASTIEAVINCL